MRPFAGSVPLTVLPTLWRPAHEQQRPDLHPAERGGGAGRLLRDEPGRGRLVDLLPERRHLSGRRDEERRLAELQRAAARTPAAVPQRLHGPGQLHLQPDRANSTGGTSQSRFEPYLDNARPQLDAGRSAYNITQLVNANLIFDLPFGQGRKWLNKGGVTNVLVGGWQMSSIVHWQSGSPLGIYSTRGTFNRANRSGASTANSTLSVDQIEKLFKVTKLADGRILLD